MYQFPRIKAIYRHYDSAEDTVSYTIGRNDVEEILDKCLKYPDAKHYEFWIIKKGQVIAQLIGGNLEVIR